MAIKHTVTQWAGGNNTQYNRDKWVTTFTAKEGDVAPSNQILNDESDFRPQPVFGVASCCDHYSGIYVLYTQVTYMWD